VGPARMQLVIKNIENVVSSSEAQFCPKTAICFLIRKIEKGTTRFQIQAGPEQIIQCFVYGCAAIEVDSTPFAIVQSKISWSSNII